MNIEIKKYGGLIIYKPDSRYTGCLTCNSDYQNVCIKSDVGDLTLCLFCLQQIVIKGQTLYKEHKE